MRLKNKRLVLPLVGVVALMSFVIGVMISSSLRITPAIKATEKGVDESSGYSPINNSQVFVKLAEKLMPATVNISTTKIVKRSKRSNQQPFREGDPFRDFFGNEFYEKALDKKIRWDSCCWNGKHISQSFERKTVS